MRDLSEAILWQNHALQKTVSSLTWEKFTTSYFAGVLILRHCAEAFREIHQTLALLPMPLKTNAASLFEKMLQEAALVSLVVALGQEYEGRSALMTYDCPLC